jgi:hypothetical protein
MKEIKMEYKEFLDMKNNQGADTGFTPIFMINDMFDFQRSLTEWAIKKGRAAIFADCGLGKTLMELVWSENIHRKTNKPVLNLAPLAVTYQTVKEGAKFGVEVIRSNDGKIKNGIIITNYQQLHKFNPADFAGVVCDESGILKSFDGATRDLIINFMKKMPYRLLATATAAPNDYFELGNSSEALGYLGFLDILTRYFKNDQNNCSLRKLFGEMPKFRFKGHSEIPFWRFVTSWARAIRKPSDLGFDDTGFILHPLEKNNHIIETDYIPPGMLFSLPATNLRSQREETKRTVKERCEKAAAIVSEISGPSVLWCNRNEEGDLLEKIIPESTQVSGKDKDDSKERKFIDFSEGNIKRLITKPKIGAWGLNWQHCAHMVYFPNHSYEQLYQSIRRCWRFGQKNKVIVDFVLSEGEVKILENIQRKSDAADIMFNSLLSEMNNSLLIEKDQKFKSKMELPSWL